MAEERSGNQNEDSVRHGRHGASSRSFPGQPEDDFPCRSEGLCEFVRPGQDQCVRCNHVRLVQIHHALLRGIGIYGRYFTEEVRLGLFL